MSGRREASSGNSTSQIHFWKFDKSVLQFWQINVAIGNTKNRISLFKTTPIPFKYILQVDKNIRCRKMCSFKTNFDLEAGLEPQQLNLFEKTSIPFKVKLNFHFSNFPLFKFGFKLNIFWTTYIHFRGKEHFGLEFISPFRSEVSFLVFESLKMSNIHFVRIYPSELNTRQALVMRQSHLVEPAWLWVSGFPKK